MDINMDTCLQWSNVVQVKFSVLPVGHQLFRWGVLALYSRFHSYLGVQISLICLAAGSDLVSDTHEVVVLDMHEAHSKHTLLILINFQ